MVHTARLPQSTFTYLDDMDILIRRGEVSELRCVGIQKQEERCPQIISSCLLKALKAALKDFMIPQKIDFGFSACIGTSCYL